MSNRELYVAIDKHDGVESVFLFVGDRMYVSDLIGVIEDDPWFDKELDLSSYYDVAAKHEDMINPKRIW